MKKRLWIIVLTIGWSQLTTAYASFKLTFPQGHYDPQYFRVQGNMAGFLPDLMRHFANDSGIEFEMASTPIKRNARLLENGQVDFILPSNPAWADNPSGRLHFSDAILISRSGFVRRSESAGKPFEIVATVAGYTLPELNSPYSEFPYQLIETIDTDASLGMLKAGRVDTVYAHLDFVRKWLELNKLKHYLIFEKDAGYDNYSYHLATIEYPEILQMFNLWMQDNKTLIDKLRRRYSVGTESLL
ncbi:substrate-binding periplasmic protein [Neptunicella sp. SCSIO 80796]|uniref:substrate-binding periplasmic protein n=1 Tax=Neptunicella plasticusilytica TaxID=3117012 RepID=UPI003A4E46FC